jgi:hypothetical protein
MINSKEKKRFPSFLVQAPLFLALLFRVSSFVPPLSLSRTMFGTTRPISTHTRLKLAEDDKKAHQGSDKKGLLVDEEEEEAVGLPLDTIWSRSLDTVEDALRLATRLPVEKGWIERPPMPEDETCPSLVVLGSGWAAHALLKIVDTTKTRLTVISPSNHFVFTPSMYLETASKQ